MEKGEEKKGRKAKRDEQKNEREKWTKKKVMTETGNMLKDENETKRDGTKTKNEGFFWADFFLWFKVKGEKDLKKQK